MHNINHTLQYEITIYNDTQALSMDLCLEPMTALKCVTASAATHIYKHAPACTPQGTAS